MMASAPEVAGSASTRHATRRADPRGYGKLLTGMRIRVQDRTQVAREWSAASGIGWQLRYCGRVPANAWYASLDHTGRLA